MSPDEKLLEQPFDWGRKNIIQTDDWEAIDIPDDAIYVYIENTETTAGRNFRVSYRNEKKDQDYFVLTATGPISRREWIRKNGFMPKQLWVKAVVIDTWLYYEIWAPGGKKIRRN